MNILNMYTKWGLFMIILSLVSCTSKTQYLRKNGSLGLSADETIHQLRNGTLIIVIPTFSKKLAHLEEFKGRDGLNDKDKAQIQDHIDQVELDRDKTFNGIIDGIEQHYTFSDYLFVLEQDMQLEKLNTGKITTINKAMEKVEMDFPSFYMYCYSYAEDIERYGGISYFKYNNFDYPAYPFPKGGYVKDVTVWNNILAIFGLGERELYSTHVNFAKGLEDTLSGFYKKVNKKLGS